MEQSKAFTLDVDFLQKTFSPLIGLPCWGAKRIHGSIVAIELGPVVVPPRPSRISQRRARENPQANIEIKLTPAGGEWNLTLIDASWQIEAGEYSANDESAQPDIETALDHLNGQVLSHVGLGPGRQLIVQFAEGGTIHAGSSHLHDPENDMWWLSHHDVEFTVVDGYGRVQIVPSEKSKSRPQAES